MNNHLVISEKFAQLLNDWGMKGYELREVTHKGNPIKQHPAYQLVATAYMPRCSEEWKPLYFYTHDHRCFDCHLTGFIHTPYTYKREDLSRLENDFYYVVEPKASLPAYYYHNLLISQRFRQKLLEHGITKNRFGLYSENYKSKDWAFQPVIVI